MAAKCLVIIAACAFLTIAVERSTDKRGSCPQSSVQSGQQSIKCQRVCENDNDCPGIKKCCQVGSKNTCKNPEKPGSCPRTVSAQTLCPVECTSDFDCYGADKCCTPRSRGALRICAAAQFSDKCPAEPEDNSCTDEDNDECFSDDDCTDTGAVCCLSACKRSKCIVPGCDSDCTNFCEYGFALDKGDCHTCECELHEPEA